MEKTVPYGYLVWVLYISIDIRTLKYAIVPSPISLLLRFLLLKYFTTIRVAPQKVVYLISLRRFHLAIRIAPPPFAQCCLFPRLFSR